MLFSVVVIVDRLREAGRTVHLRNRRDIERGRLSNLAPTRNGPRRAYYSDAPTRRYPKLVTDPRHAYDLLLTRVA